MARKNKPRKKTRRPSRRTISRSRRKRTPVKKPESTVISLELPQTWGPECFQDKLLSTQGFQAADLKPRYFAAYNKLLKEYGQALAIEPTGQPGITLSLKS